MKRFQLFSFEKKKLRNLDESCSESHSKLQKTRDTTMSRNETKKHGKLNQDNHKLTVFCCTITPNLTMVSGVNSGYTHFNQSAQNPQ